MLDRQPDLGVPEAAGGRLCRSPYSRKMGLADARVSAGIMCTGKAGLAPEIMPPCVSSAGRSADAGGCSATPLQACTLQQNGASRCQVIQWAHVAGNNGLAPGMKPPCGGSAARSPHVGSCRRTALQACTLQQNGASCCQGICWAHVHQKYPSSPRYHAALCFNTAISAGCRRLLCDASAGLCAAAKRGELVQLCLRDSRASMTPSSPQQRGPLC